MRPHGVYVCVYEGCTCNLTTHVRVHACCMKEHPSVSAVPKHQNPESENHGIPLGEEFRYALKGAQTEPL